MSNDKDCTALDINFVSLKDIKPEDMELIAINQVLKEYPFIEQEMKWSEKNIAFFYECKLLLGKKSENTGQLWIDRLSLERLIEYHRKVAREKQK